MKRTYRIKYRQPGQWFWRVIKDVVGDGIDVPGRFRFFHTEEDAIHYIDLAAEVVFPPERQAIITHKMSKEAGTPVQRA